MSAQSLLRSNLIAAGAHLLSALVVIWAYNHWPVAQEKADVKAYRLQIAGPSTPDQCTTTGGSAPTPDQCQVEISFQQPKAAFSANVIYGAIFFFLITAAAHAWYGTDGFGSGSYTTALSQGWNPYRWFEYGLSASIMIVIIGLVDGTRDATTLGALFGATTAMMLTGFTTESLLRGRGAISNASRDAITGSTVVGWLLFVTVWATLLYSFGTLVSDVNSLYKNEVDASGNPVRVPTWIWYIVIAQLLYYAAFGIVQALHVRDRLSGRNNFDYVTVEKRYIQLSYWSKLSLASGIAYGLIWRVKDCPQS